MALLSGGTFWFAVPPEDALSDLPVVRVNADDRLMAHWASEDVNGDAGAPPFVARTPDAAIPAARRVAVLVDGETRSAAEIFAAAIQSSDRGAVVGERTFGKGTAQSLFPLRSAPGAALPAAGLAPPTLSLPGVIAPPGVVAGLAWTSMGGATLYVEATKLGGLSAEEGKPLPAQHRLVYSALEVEMKTIHALNIKTFTPAKWAARS